MAHAACGARAQQTGYSLFDLRRIFLVRIFNKSFDRGGRFFHGFWEEMMRAVRRNLQIDGEEIREYDYSGCHTRLAYHVVGRAHELAVDPDRDLYEVSGLRRDRWRDRIKRATMIALNAPNYQSAVGAISALLNKKDGSRYKDHRRCKVIAHRLLVRIKQRHPALAKLWHTGIGLSLQAVESHIVAACLEELLDRAVLGLSTHDAISVQARHHGMLVEVMERKFNELAPLLAAELGARHRLRDCRERNVRHSDGDLTLREGKGEGGSLAPIPSQPESISPPDFGSPRHLVAPSLPLTSNSPLLADVAKIIGHNQSISHSVIKVLYAAARQTATQFDPAIDKTVLSLSTVCSGFAVTVPPRSTVSKVTRGFNSLAVVTGAWAARICRITADMSDRLGLVAIRPAADPKERAAAERRIEDLLQGKVPSIVAFPKSKLGTGAGKSRASWYRRAPIDRQIAAIEVLRACGDESRCAAVAEKLAQVQRDRACILRPGALPVDELIERAIKALLSGAQIGLPQSGTTVHLAGHAERPQSQPTIGPARTRPPVTDHEGIDEIGFAGGDSEHEPPRGDDQPNGDEGGQDSEASTPIPETKPGMWARLRSALPGGK